MPAHVDQRLRGNGTAFASGVPLGDARVDMETLAQAAGGALVRGRILPRGWDLRDPQVGGVVDLVLGEHTYRLSPTRSHRFSRWLHVIGYEQTAS